MKRNITLLVLALFVMGFHFMANAQIIDVYAGNDTVELKAGNYQYGFIQWQYSLDNVNYADIEDATAEVYRCLPDRNTYYRAMVTFSNCQPIFSKVCHVQLSPKANGGPSRVLAEGDGAMLYARLEEDCIGEWKIIEGAGGSLDDPSSPTCYFIGTDAEYKLTWTVTNAAGSDTDTISIKYIHTIYNENFSVVDTTDVILSDSAQMASGLYIVQFSDPIPHIEDSTLLIGVGEQSFIRKVTGFEANGNVYTIQTTDASIYDLVIEGAMSIDYSDYDVSNRRHQIIHRYPTRKDLMKEDVKSGKYIFMPKAVEDKLKASMKQRDGEMPYVSLDVGIINLSDFQLELIPRHDFKPNFVHNFVKDRWWHISAFQFGLYNAEYIKQSEIRIGACNVQIPFLASGPKGPFFSTPLPAIIVAGAPLVIDLDVYYEYSLEGFMSFSPSYRYYQRDVSYYTRAIEYENGNWWTVSDESEEHNKEVEGLEHGTIGLDVFAGVRMTFMLYKVLGPYLSVGPYWNLKFNTTPNFAAASEAGVRILIGVQSRKFLGYQFDFAASLNCPATRFEFPNKLYYISGNRQRFELGNFLAEPLKVKVTSSRTDAPFLRTKVKFETDNGAFSESEVRTDGEGCAETRWKPNHTETGTATARAYVCDVDGRVVDGAPIYFTAYENNFAENDCANSTLSVRAEKRNGFLMPVASAGDPPYSYSEDGVIYDVLPPQVIPIEGATYIFFVRDRRGCVEQCSYTEPVFTCYNNHPSLTVTQTGNTLVAEATGGTPPYEYSIDGVNYSESGTFEDLENGEYIVSVRDSKSCTDVYYYELLVQTDSEEEGDDTHGYVDLGLPSGTLWATCNMGANAPEEYGDYYAWGETQTKDYYDWSTYQYCNGSENTLTKYCGSPEYGYNGYTDNLTALLPEDDAATVNWGSAWRMPTKEEWEELNNNCTSTWTTLNGVEGKLFIATNGNSLFLPAAGDRFGTSVHNETFYGFYWSKTLASDDMNKACYFFFRSGYTYTSDNNRYLGHTIRPVRASSQVSSYTINVTPNPTLGGVVSGGGNYPGGAACTLTATANAGYTFSNWTENGNVVSVYANYTFTVSGNRNLVANFTAGDAHEYVDLGLPSGTLWATCNVGANAPEEYGGYFAWGETVPKVTYNWITYQYCNGRENALTKYCNNSNYGYNGFTDDLTTLLPEDDAATANWGNGWRMPTQEEWNELLDNTTLIWTQQNGVNGCLFTASNGNRLFLPAAGRRMDGELYDAGSAGTYWSGLLNTGYPSRAGHFYFHSDDYNVGSYYRDYGLSVRPVRSARQN